MALGLAHRPAVAQVASGPALFSDIHLTGGTSGETINTEAFSIFANRIGQFVQKRNVKDDDLLLL